MSNHQEKRVLSRVNARDLTSDELVFVHGGNTLTTLAACTFDGKHTDGECGT
ncbi:MAG TPA: hypothetical protein VG759_25760 [Candidatus Angelobacter sp.]|jgi:hypothetical protein|nr:hypothetical protein [Candidatus Angelobacter sp.]